MIQLSCYKVTTVERNKILNHNYLYIKQYYKLFVYLVKKKKKLMLSLNKYKLLLFASIVYQGIIVHFLLFLYYNVIALIFIS